MKIVIQIPSKEVIFKYLKIIIIIVLIAFCILNFYFLLSNNDAINSLDKEFGQLKQQQNISITNPMTTEESTYKLMYENIKYSNDKILDTIYWAIGALFTAVLALFGAQVFFNYRFNKKEIENITKDIDLKTDSLTKNISLQIDDFKSRTTNELNLKINDFFEKARSEFNKDISSELDRQQKRIDTFSDTINNLINSTQKLFEDKINKLSISIETYNQSTDKKTNSLIEKISNSKTSLQSDLLDLEAEIWRLKGVEGNVFGMYLRSTLKQIEINEDIEINLKKIIDSIQLLNYIPKNYQGYLYELIQNIPEHYIMYREKLESFAKNLPSK